MIIQHFFRVTCLPQLVQIDPFILFYLFFLVGHFLLGIGNDFLAIIRDCGITCIDLFLEAIVEAGFP